MPETTGTYKPLVLVDTENLPEDEWLEWRRRGIGGSDAAAILGVSPFTTARDLYYDKLKVISYEDGESNWVAKKVGHLLEDLVAEIFHVKTGFRIYQVKKMFYHPVYTYMLADIDYFIELPNGKTAILEIKTTNYNAKDHWWCDGQEIVPINYEIQGRHYMCVMNIDEVYYCCLYGNNEDEVIIRHIVRDLDYEAELIDLEGNFWNKAKEDDLPIDGLVITYDSISYSSTCGRTGHHFKDGLAFKFEDDLFKTRLDHIEWTPTRSGEISPVAVFDTVEIDGCEVSRATLHNLSFIEGLELMPGNRILVSKRNMIIPQVEENLDRGGFCMEDLVPSLCPCCGYQTMVHTTKKRVNGELKLTKTLFCHNPNCASQNLRKFVHFVSKKAMDIEGLSEATLEQFIDRGWLLDFTDIYRLDQHREEIIRMDGFGEKSWQRLWNAIQKSRNTSFERYLIAMDIPMIGSTASSALGSCFDWSLRAFEVAVDTGYDFTQIPDFGETLQNNIFEWFSIEENRILWEELKDMVSIEKKETNISEVRDNPFVGKTLVVTGKVEPYTRDGINAKITSLGAKAGSSVSKNTDYLICGENAGSKLTKAQSLGVTVLSPAEFFSMIGE